MVALKEFQRSLSRFATAYLDTNIFIYHLANHFPFSDFTQTIFESMQKGKLKGHTSSLTLLECNVKPYQMENLELALLQKALIQDFPNLVVHPMDPDQADLAAYYRAKYRLKTPDAIHLACAIGSKSEVFIGNDRDFKGVQEITFFPLRV